MATTTISTFTAVAGKLIVDDDLGSTESENVTSASSGKIFMVEIDNTLNTVPVYLKIRDASSVDPTVSASNGDGTPELMFYAPSAKSITYVMPEGHTYDAGVSMWCVTSPTVANTTSPGSDVTVSLLCS